MNVHEFGNAVELASANSCLFMSCAITKKIKDFMIIFAAQHFMAIHLLAQQHEISFINEARRQIQNLASLTVAPQQSPKNLNMALRATKQRNMLVSKCLEKLEQRRVIYEIQIAQQKYL